jgi:hypothetical protein
MKNDKKKKQGWSAVMLRDGVVYICNNIKRHEVSRMMDMKGFTGEVNESGKLTLSKELCDERIGIMWDQRIPANEKRLEEQLEFLKFCKKNKLNGEALDERLEKDLKK